MEELIKKVYEEKLANGSIEKIISEEIDKMVKSVCCSLFEWNGVIKNQMNEKIKEVMSTVIEKSDFSKYVQKLTYIINETLPNTALEDYREIAKRIEETCGKKSLTNKNTIKLSEIFKKYCSYLENKTFSDGDFENDSHIEIDDDGRTYYLNATMKVKGNTIRFYLDDDNLEENVKNNFSFEIRKYGSTIYYRCEKTMDEIALIDSFEMFLIMLSNNNVKLEEDDSFLEECITVDVEC